MDTAGVAAELSRETVKVRAWQLEQLSLACGGDEQAAMRLFREGADWHRVARAAELGATVDELLRIFG